MHIDKLSEAELVDRFMHNCWPGAAWSLHFWYVLVKKLTRTKYTEAEQAVCVLEVLNKKGWYNWKANGLWTVGESYEDKFQGRAENLTHAVMVCWLKHFYQSQECS